MERFVDMWRQVVLSSGGASGCVVAGVALDTSATDESDSLLSVARAVFRSWVAVLANQLETAGIPAQRAAGIAMITLASMEGALILCRAEGDVRPLDETAAELMRLLPSDAG
jgi:TetR/AcrR family transcriptional regulator, lmrAB and yxaGH operons repressor